MSLGTAEMLDLFVATLACFGAGALGALLAASRPDVSRVIGHVLALLGAAGALALGMAGLTGGTLQVNLPDLLPVGGGVALGLDRLSAFFVVVIAVGALPAALYALDYTREYQGRRSLTAVGVPFYAREVQGRHSLAALGALFNLFLASMLLVTLARNVLTFLVLWEVMSLVSYFLVMTEHEREDVPRAGWVYLVMTHAGFAALFVGMLLLAQATGTMNLADWTSRSGPVSETTRQIVFVLLALGFGSKAGIVPLHVWLPRAHPAAPSHVSALMSGVMIKLGVYGLIRVAFDWLGAGPAWWGCAVLIVAAVSAVLGVLYALVEHDLKRLLAYHSVENIGIILLGVGAAMLFQTYRLDGLAALALVAALYHTLNHATFKSLLFMGAGAILQATRTRNMEEMGGLIKRMPQTAVFFLIGSAAIAALPPLNGFVSEWLTFQALLASVTIPSHAVNLIFAVAIAALALTSGLAAACFVKAFGIPFLALPRSVEAEHAHEAGGAMRAAMAILAFLCVALGIAPFAILPALTATARDLAHASADLQFDASGLVATAPQALATVSPLWIAVALAALLAALPLALRLLGANPRQRVYETWGCGRAVQTARFEYTATAFANPFKRVFGLLYRPVKDLDIEFHPESRFFVQAIAYRNEARTIVEETLYHPLLRLIRWSAHQARVVQSGNVHSYLLYILVALVALLMVTR